MEQTNDRETTNMSTGILSPVFAHRFRVLFPTGSKNINIFSMQVERCLMNFTKRTLEIHVQQAVADNGMLKEMCKFMRKRRLSVVYVDLLDGNDKVIRRIVFDGLQPSDHTFNLDYAICAVATHIMKFTFDDVDALEVEPQK